MHVTPHAAPATTLRHHSSPTTQGVGARAAPAHLKESHEAAALHDVVSPQRPTLPFRISTGPTVLCELSLVCTTLRRPSWQWLGSQRRSTMMAPRCLASREETAADGLAASAFKKATVPAATRTPVFFASPPPSIDQRSARCRGSWLPRPQGLPTQTKEEARRRGKRKKPEQTPQS